MLRHNVSLSVEAETSVVNLFFANYLLWEASTDNIFVERLREATEHLRCLTGLIRFVVRKERLLVLEHVCLGIRGHKHLREDNNISAISCGLLYWIRLVDYLSYSDHLFSSPEISLLISYSFDLYGQQSLMSLRLPSRVRL